MKDFWKFMGKLFLAIALIVLVVVLVKKFKKSDPVNFDEDEIVYHYPKNTAVGRIPIKNDDFSADRSSANSEKFSRQLDMVYNNLTKQLKKVNDKVNTQERKLDGLTYQTNGSLINVRDKINLLNKTLYRHLEGKSAYYETTTADSKDKDDIFPFAPLENSCQEPFNDHPNISRYVPIIPNSKDTPNKNTDIGDNKLTPATCILILRKPVVPVDNKVTLMNPSDEYRVSIAGVVAAKASEFVVDICIDTNVLLHINPKFDEKQIILTSQDSYWDTSSKKFYAPLDGMVPGHKFQITVTLQKNVFQIEVNNAETTLFQNRDNDTTSTERNIRIRGDVYLNLLTFEILDKPDNESATNSSSISNSLLTPFGF